MTQFLRNNKLNLTFKLVGLFFAIISALVANGANANQPRLKSNISIVGDIVTLGDLFENAGPAATKAVFRSPRLGKTGILNHKRIELAAREHGLEWSNPDYLVNIVIRREAHTISLDSIRHRIAEQLTNNYPPTVSGAQLEISLNKKSAPFVMRADGAGEFEIQKLKFIPGSGRFSAVIASSAGSQDAKRASYSGRAVEVIEVPVLSRIMSRGQTIKIGHLGVKKVPARRIGPQTLTEAVDLVGMATRRSLRPDTLLRKNDVEKPRIVKRNTLVSVIYKIKTLQITTRGRALEDGALGETITVLNPRSRRTIQVIVTGPNAVTANSGFLFKTASITQ